MELKSYEFLRTVIYQGKFGATPGDTLQQIGTENYHYNGRRGLIEVILRDTTIASYLANGFIKETTEATEQVEPEPEVAVVVAPVIPTPPAPVRPNLKPAVPQSRAVDAKAKMAAQRPTGVVPPPAPKTAPVPAPKPVVAAPKPTPIIVAVAEPRKPEPTATPLKKVAAGKTVAPPRPELVNPVVDAALTTELGEAEAIDAVLSRQKKVVRKGR